MNDKKHLLKETFKEFFPKDFLNKPKKGFEVPVGDWMRGFMKKELLYYGNSNFLKKQDLFNEKYIVGMISNHINGGIYIFNNKIIDMIQPDNASQFNSQAFEGIIG